MRVLIVLALIGVTYASEAAIFAPAPLAYSSFFVDEPKPSYEYSTSVQTPNYNNYAHVRSGPEFERKVYNFATPIAAPILSAEPIVTEAKILSAPVLKAAPILKASPLSAELRPTFQAFAANPISTTKLLPFAYEAKPFEQHFLPFYRYAPTPAIVTAEPASAAFIENKAFEARFLGEKSQYHSQNSLGEATYGHREPFQAHDAVQDAEGNKAGSFSYVAPDGRVLTTEYVADSGGYRVASNALPQASVPLPVAAPLAIVSEKPAESVSESGDGIVVEGKSRSRRSVAFSAPVLKAAPVPAPSFYTYPSQYAYSYQPYSYTPYVSSYAYNAYSAPLYRSYPTYYNSLAFRK